MSCSWGFKPVSLTIGTPVCSTTPEDQTLDQANAKTGMTGSRKEQ